MNRSGIIHTSAFLVMAVGMVGPAKAVTLAECDRTTHISHGGEAGHVDLGGGRVMWRDWWSQEGTATDIMIVDCADGEALRFRTAEERMSERLPFDRTADALKIVDEQMAGARAFATLPRLADALAKTAKDIEITTLTAEPCACAALYGDLRGNKTEFALGG